MADISPPTRHRAGGYAAKDVAKCSEKVAKDHMRASYPAELKAADTDFIASLKSGGLEFEANIFADMSRTASGRARPGVVLLTEELDADGNRTEGGKAAVETATFAAMLNPSTRVILGGRIGSVFESLLDTARGGSGKELDPDRISQPDVLLVPAERDSNGLPPHVTPVDVKDHAALAGASPKNATVSWAPLNAPSTRRSRTDGHGTIRFDDLMQLAHYYRHLQALTLADPQPQGAIVGRELQLIYTRLDLVRFAHPGTGARTTILAVYDHWLARYFAVVANAQARDTDDTVAALTSPERQTGCGYCPWRSVCDDELKSWFDGGHITLLPGVTPAKAKPHYAAGVHAIKELARLHIPTALAVEVGTPVEAINDPDMATLAYADTGIKELAKSIRQARVMHSGRVCRAVGVGTVDLSRADIEVDFDLENSSGPVGDGTGHHGGPLVYLWGTRTTTRMVTRDGAWRTTIRDRQFADFTDTSAGEATAFAAFWAFLTESRSDAVKAGMSWRAFHYTRHELSWMRKLAARYPDVAGVPTVNDVDEFLATGDVVDEYAALTQQLVWPTTDHSIKTLAKWARFSWRASDAGGDSSLVWYRDAVIAETEQERTSNQVRLLAYNVDDVAAQLHLRDWIDSLQAAENPSARIPSVTALLGPSRRPRRSAA